MVRRNGRAPVEGSTPALASNHSLAGSETSSPTASPARLELSGTLVDCGGNVTLWCIADSVLDFGDEAKRDAAALADFDGDGAVESNDAELAGLENTSVTVEVLSRTSPRLVLTLEGRAYMA